MRVPTSRTELLSSPAMPFASSWVAGTESRRAMLSSVSPTLDDIVTKGGKGADVVVTIPVAGSVVAPSTCGGSPRSDGRSSTGRTIGSESETWPLPSTVRTDRTWDPAVVGTKSTARVMRPLSAAGGSSSW